MFEHTRDIPRRRRFYAGMVGGGGGAFFAGHHRAAMRLCNRYQIVAGAFSSDPALCREAGDAFALDSDRIYMDFKQMVARERERADCIDVAIVVTPNHLHYEPCKLFLEAGIPVICDKPLVNFVEEARELARIAERNNIFFAVTYTYTGYPMVRDARARIRNGDLGEIRFMYVEYLLEWLAEGTSKLGTKASSWRGDPLKAGPTGAIGDIGTHAFNMMEYLSGQRCTKLNAKLTNTAPGWVLDDNAVVQLEFDRGADGLLWASLAAPGHRNGLRFNIVGTKASLKWKQEAPETLLLGRLGEGDIIYRRGQGDLTPDAKSCSSLPPGSPEGYLEALANLYADYAKALEAGASWRTSLTVPLTDIHEGVRGVAFCEACLESSKSQEWSLFPGS